MLAAEGFKALHFTQLWAAGGITTFESCIPAAGALLGISGFKLDPHYCQLPVAEEVQPDRNSCPADSSRIDSSVDRTRLQLYQANLRQLDDKSHCVFFSVALCLSQVGGRGLQSSTLCAAVGDH